MGRMGTVVLLLGYWMVGPVAGSGPEVGDLTVATDPSGATVYVDGALVGRTPLRLEKVSAGDHRIRVAKDGFLDNARVVAVAAGKQTNVTTKLTVNTSGSPKPVAQDPADSGLLSNKWLWIGAAAGGGTAALLLMNGNTVPVAGSVTAPTFGLMGAPVSFASTGASDPDGDTLTYSWNFGDNGTGTGQQLSHIFNTAGAFTVTVTVSDGSKSATASATTTIKSLAAQFRGTLDGTLTTINFTHTGTSLGGTYSDSFGPGTISSGAIGATGQINFTVTQPPFAPWTFTGTASSDINTLTGVANGSGFSNTSWVLTRQ
jgi:hypothetical protein